MKSSILILYTPGLCMCLMCHSVSNKFVVDLSAVTGETGSMSHVSTVKLLMLCTYIFHEYYFNISKAILFAYILYRVAIHRVAMVKPSLRSGLAHIRDK